MEKTNENGNDEVNTFLETITNLEAFELKLKTASEVNNSSQLHDKDGYQN